MSSLLKKILILSVGLLLSCIPAQKVGKLKFQGGNQTFNNNENIDNGNLFLEARAVNVRFGDRVFIKRTLEKIYGTSSSKYLTTSLSKVNLFGGVCDYYGEFVGDGDRCESLEENVQIPTSTTLRSGYIIRICEEINGDDKIFSSLLSRLKVDGTKKLETVSIEKYYKTFYPLETVSKDFTTHMLKLNNLVGTDYLLAHRLAVITVCSSSGWQIL